MQEYRNGPTLFDKVWLQLIDKLLTSGAGAAHALEVKFPSVLDVCPTLAMPQQQIADVMAGCLRTSVSIGRGFEISPDRPMVIGVNGGVNIYLLPTDKGVMNVSVEAAELGLLQDLPNVALWISQIALTRMAYTKARPGWVRMFIGSLYTGTEEEQKKLQGVLMDHKIDAMPERVRRSRDTIFTGSWPAVETPSVVEEYDVALCAAVLLARMPVILKMDYTPFLRHTLAMDALRCLLSNQKSIPFMIPLGDSQDAAIRATLERRLFERKK